MRLAVLETQSGKPVPVDGLRPSTYHVPDMQFCHFAICKIGGLVAFRRQHGLNRMRVFAALNGHSHENFSAVSFAQSVVEFSDDPFPQRIAELTKRPGPFRNGHGKKRLMRFAEFGSFGDESQAIEVHVRAAEHGDKMLPADSGPLHIRFHAGDGQSACGFDNSARVVEDVFDCGTDLIVADQNDFIDRGLNDRQRAAAHLANGNAVGKQTDVRECYRMTCRDGLSHRVGVHRLHADHFDFR
jgi:hypothetical protein